MEIISRNTKHRFQVALSFAGEDRDFSESVANGLKSKGISVFYDNDYQSELWGTYLPEKLREIYNTESRYCIIFLSASYKKKCGQTMNDGRHLIGQ